MWRQGRRWEAFCGYPHRDCVRLLRQAAEETGLPVSQRRETQASLQAFMLGADEVTVLHFGDPAALTVRVIPATHDPFSRFLLRLAGGARGDVGLCFVAVGPVTPATRGTVGEVLRAFMRLAPHSPWEITHPRFKIALGLQWRTRRLWRRWEETPHVDAH